MFCNKINFAGLFLNSMSSTLRRRATGFLEQPDAPQALGFFRIAIAGFALLQAIIWYPDWLSFFSPDGWLQWEISEALNNGWSLHISYVHAALKHFGFSPAQSVMIFYWFYLSCVAGLLAGWHTRICSILTCSCHYVIMCSLPTFNYGVDIFLQIAFFYLMVMPAAGSYSLDVWQGRVKNLATWGAALSIRVIQIHLCMVYLSAGAEKLRSPDWWNGNTLWRSLVQPDFSQFNLTWLAHYPWLLILLSWFTMITETGYLVAMWVPRLRVLWLAAVAGLHLGIAIFLGLWLFGLIMIVLSVSAFGLEVLRDLKEWYAKKHDLHWTGWRFSSRYRTTLKVGLDKCLQSPLASAETGEIK